MTTSPPRRPISSSTARARLPWLAALLLSACLGAQAQGFGLGAAAQSSAQSGTQPSAEFANEQVRVSLLAHAPQGVPTGDAAAGAGAGQDRTVWLGLRIEHQPHWHTYWKNPGDSGLPTELQWRLPEGVVAGDIAWPVPQKIAVGDMTNYGYEGGVLLAVPLTVTAQYRPSPLATHMDVGLAARWLACRQECIPQEADLALKLPLKSSTALHGALFEHTLARQPAELPASPGQTAGIEDGGQRLSLRVHGLPDALRGQTLDVLAEAAGVLRNTPDAHAKGATPASLGWTQQWQGGAWTASLPVSPDRMDAPEALALVLTAADGQAWRVQATVQGAWPASAAPAAAGLSPALEAALQANAAEHGAGGNGGAATNAAATPTPPTPVPAGTWLATLLAAFAGGLILNLMPCVFPVLALKVMEFASHAQDGRARRVGGLAYGVGVVLSFLALGALMLALRGAGQRLGWGFQLQSPAVVAALAVLFAVIGLNLAGVFEFGTFVPNRLATMQARRPALNAFLSGVLAVAVASPCTAPFMGASLGLAIGMPAAQALAVFAAIGAGMALPYVLASWLPAVARLMPRPGAWMAVFKNFMAFPMFGTVAWLVWVLGQQSGVNGAAALLALLVALAAALWALGLKGRARWAVGAPVLLTGGWLLLALGPLVTHIDDTPATHAAAAPAAQTHWQPWSPQRQQALIDSGQPVFVNYSAAWCVTCQYNKKTTLSNAQVLAALDRAGVQTLLADWTRRDPVISEALQKLGRTGVPTYVLHVPGRAPVVMSEVLGKDELLDALAAVPIPAGTPASPAAPAL